MIAHFKPASRIALFLSAATLIAVCCFTFTRAAEKKVAPREAAASTPQAASSREAGRRSETESSGVQSVQRMRQKLDELKARVRQAEEIVDELRRRYIIPSWVAEGKSESSFDSETIRRLEASRIEVESNYRGLAASLTQLRELKSQGSDTVRKAMLTVNYDPQLGKLLENLWATEATLAKLKETVASDHPEFKSVAAMRADLDQRVSERIEGILSGIEAKAAATKAQMESIAREVDEAKKRDAESTANYRPYFQAKRDLESLQKIRDALYLKVLEQEYGVEVPKVKSEER